MTGGERDRYRPHPEPLSNDGLGSSGVAFDGTFLSRDLCFDFSHRIASTGNCQYIRSLPTACFMILSVYDIDIDIDRYSPR